MKVYNAGQGGAFRLFIADNKTDVAVIDYKTSLTNPEKLFIDNFSFKYNFKNNLKPTHHTGTKDTYEWYSVDNSLLDHINKQQKEYIRDINGSLISLQELEQAKKAAEFIRNKINFYNTIEKINPAYLLPEKYIKKLAEFDYEYPFIIKSIQGKGGKGNLVCFSGEDLKAVHTIILSELFASKQENKSYNTDSRVIIEKFFPNSLSYNYSFYCSKEGLLKHGYVSQQIIDEVFYRGNMYPSNLSQEKLKKVKDIGEEICNYIHEKHGFIGWIGIDFIQINDKIYVLEANPRVNSVTHAYNLTQGNAFVIKLLKHKHKSIESVFDHFFFNNAVGVLPYQIPNSEEILLISAHHTLDQAIKQMEAFKGQNLLEDVIQGCIGPYSKSISYYISKMKECV